ncbi:Ldh family oxidoreductase [Oceanobacillus halophilus]|uniref:Ldh family oxidoreductase n=1 Tax=Oceanobacillus halophilus TaxID=930130 RepID=UPI001F4E0925|nr:Ldh family oxidoreductase [Oceanobacillus halophilus]
MKEQIVTVENAKKFAIESCSSFNISEEESKIFAEVLVEADMRGIMTHGLIRLPDYIKRIKKCGMEPKLNIEIIKDWPWGGSLNAGNGIGHVAAYKGMQWVIGKAKKHGMGMATMNMSNHFGIASFYSIMAAEQNMIGIAASNSPPIMAPWGGMKANIGNNPIAISVPGKDFPISLDIACSVSARGKLYKAQREGTQIPKNWALNAKGEETTSPAEALEGVLLPLAGHKGYGIALMIDILTGILSGGTVSPNIKGKYDYSAPRDIGHFFLAIDIERFLPVETFLENLDEYVKVLQNTETGENVDKVRVSGESGSIRRKHHIENGIPYHLSTIKILDEMAIDIGIPLIKSLGRK